MKNVIITLSGGFSDELYKKLCDGIADAWGECEFTRREDKTLLGGFTVECGGVVYDRSIKSKLKQMKSHIEM